MIGAGPLVGVLALQGDVAEHVRAFDLCGVRTTTVRTAAEMRAVDALAMPGGESTTMGHLLRVFDLEHPLREALDGGLPVLATCAGMILLSRTVLDGRPDQLTLGALDLAVRRNGYGRQVDSFEADLLVAGLDGGPFHALFIRAPVIERAGDGVEVLASVDGRPAAIAEGSHLALSFHPEMTGDPRLHRLFLERSGLLAG